MSYKNFFQAAVLFTAAVLAGCTNDYVVKLDGKSEQPTMHSSSVTFTSETAAAQPVPSLRTIIAHSLGLGATPYWSAGDKIWVKDNGGQFRQSEAGTFNTEMTKGAFQVTGEFSEGCMVNYTGANGAAGNQVTIAKNQEQSGANNFDHAGVSGDCGTGTATGGGNSYKFKLSHKASYLCFLPRTSNEYVKRSKLFRIEIVSESPIAGTYDFSNGTLSNAPIANASNTIMLTMKNALPITNSSTKINENGSYIVIAPGTHSLAVRYWLRNETDNPDGPIEGTVTKYIDITCEPGKIYDVTANLNPQDLSTEYYMWDAKKEYWFGYKNLQPKVSHGKNAHYPKSQQSDPERWHYVPPSTDNWAANTAAQCPTINQIIWYTQKGDPHWDGTELWSLLGHLRKGGMWLKKQEVIAAENHTTKQNMYAAYNGIDYRLSTNEFPEYSFSNNSVVNGRPVKSKINNYFYLPAKGFYRLGEFQYVSAYGYYWSATSSRHNTDRSFSLNFSKSSVSLGSNYQFYGFSQELKY